MTDSDCVFCRIVAGEIPASVVYEDAEVICFEDLHPQAPVHVLAVPKKHVADVVELAAHPALLSAVVNAAGTVAAERAGGDFRLVFNTGADAGQTVFHAHGHILAGAPHTEGDLTSP